MWQDKPQWSPWPDSEAHSNHRLGSLLSSNKWQMQHEHRLQNVSSMEIVARHAEFLHIHEFEHLKSEHCSVEGGMRTGFSAFLFCFFEGCSLGPGLAFFWSWLFVDFLLIFETCSDILHFDEADCFFSLSKQVCKRSFLALDFRNSWSNFGLLEASSECPFFSGVLCTLEERLRMPETVYKIMQRINTQGYQNNLCNYHVKLILKEKKLSQASTRRECEVIKKR